MLGGRRRPPPASGALAAAEPPAALPSTAGGGSSRAGAAVNGGECSAELGSKSAGGLTTPAGAAAGGGCCRACSCCGGFAPPTGAPCTCVVEPPACMQLQGGVGRGSRGAELCQGATDKGEPLGTWAVRGQHCRRLSDRRLTSGHSCHAEHQAGQGCALAAPEQCQ